MMIQFALPTDSPGYAGKLHPEDQFKVTLDEVYEVLQDFTEHEDKHRVPMFNLAEYTFPTDSIPRLTKFITQYHGLVLDFDHTWSIDHTIEVLKGYEYILYTTHSHGKFSKDCFRVVLPLLSPLTPEELTMVRGFVLMELFDQAPRQKAPVDPTSLHNNHFFFLHSAPPERARFARTHHGSGDLYDASPLVELAQQHHAEAQARLGSPLLQALRTRLRQSRNGPEDDRGQILDLILRKSPPVQYEPVWAMCAAAMKTLGYSGEEFAQATACIMAQKSHAQAIRKFNQAKLGFQHPEGFLVNLANGHHNR